MKRPILDHLVVGHVYYSRVDHVDPGFFYECSRLTGEKQNGARLSAAFVLALRTLIESGLLPPGGVMLSYKATWYKPIPEEAELFTDLSIVEIDPSSSRRFRRVVIGYCTKRGSETLIEQRQEVLWPIGR